MVPSASQRAPRSLCDLPSPRTTSIFGVLSQLTPSSKSHETIARERSNRRRAIQNLASRKEPLERRLLIWRNDSSKTNLNHQQLESRQPSTWSDRQIPAFDISRPVHQLHCGQSGTTWTPGVTIMSSQCTRTGLQNESIRKTALRAVLTRRIGSRSSYLYHLVHFAGIGKSTASHRHQMPTIPKRGTCDQAFQFTLPQLVIHP
jgi:hypothetical protein